MKLNMTIDTDDLYGEDGMDFEYLLSKELKREIFKSCKSDLASDKFKEFSELVSDTILADIKLRFDDILLRPVDSNGKTLKGCTSSGGDTWIEWRIKDILDNKVVKIVYDAAKTIEREIKIVVEKQIIDIKDNAIKQQVDNVFAAYVSKGKL